MQGKMQPQPIMRADDESGSREKLSIRGSQEIRRPAAGELSAAKQANRQVSNRGETIRDTGGETISETVRLVRQTSWLTV
ncbi:hypothetical protein EDF62_1593 [Leucobacter luti]|uniref:Uncharacterized protein n=1 Tax=Leucobacter luti TaxID=340320 RepID=A0A4R6S178_9MICO|nr:hypothetical protein EDF62_1593 [Leucobacter luti]